MGLTMTVKTTRLAAALALLVIGVLAAGIANAQADAGTARPYRILHVISYDAAMVWSAGQFNGFKEAMVGVPVEYRVIELDVLRDPTGKSAERGARAARALVESWKPDLIYTSDDAAQKHFGAKYVDKDVPLVFSGVNADPSDYGYRGSRNVTGVIEHEHFAESVRLLQAIVPGVRRI